MTEYFNIGAMLEGTDDDDDGEDSFLISGPTELDQWLGAVTKSRNPRQMLNRVSRVQVRMPAKLRPLSNVVKRISQIGRQVLTQTGRIEAEYMRRPNVLCSIYTPVIASGGTSSFSVQPGVGNSYYRLLGFICSDEQANIFGFSSLKVGGQEHAQFSQSTPTAPVTLATPWAIFALKEAQFAANLAPWSGQVFDQSVPVTGTIANMTVAASGDAVTVAARICLLTQTDPCGTRYLQAKQAGAKYWGNLRQNLGSYAPLMA